MIKWLFILYLRQFDIIISQTVTAHIGDTHLSLCIGWLWRGDCRTLVISVNVVAIWDVTAGVPVNTCTTRLCRSLQRNHTQVCHTRVCLEHVHSMYFMNIYQLALFLVSNDMH